MFALDKKLGAAVDGILQWTDTVVYVFIGSQYLKYNPQTDQFYPGYPLPIIGNWPNWPADWTDSIQGGVMSDRPINRALIVRKGECLLYDLAQNTAKGPFPLKLAGQVPDWSAGIDGTIQLDDNNTYLFKDSRCIRYCSDTDSIATGSRQIATNWSLPANPPWLGASIQGGFVHKNGLAYLFCGDEYIAYDFGKNQICNGYPMKIQGNWKNWPTTPEWSSIDGLIKWDDEAVYFFKGTEYLRYEQTEDKIAAGYPMPISGNWKNWPSGWTGAINGGLIRKANGRAYLFSGSEYFAYDMSTNTICEGYPLPIAGNWTKLPQNVDWSSVDCLVAIDDTNFYYVKDSQIIKYNNATNTIADGYPALVAEELDAWPLAWNGRIAGSFSTGSTTVIVSSGSNDYISYDTNRKPFYIIGHNPNTLADAEECLKNGVNAIEPDMNIYSSSDNTALCVSHGEGSSDAPTIDAYFAGIAALAKKYPKFALVYLDIKSGAATTQHVQTLMNCVRTQLAGTNLKIIYSTATLSNAMAAFTATAPQLQPGEAMLIDYENDPIAVSTFFSYRGVARQGYGNGRSIQASAPAPTPSANMAGPSQSKYLFLDSLNEETVAFPNVISSLKAACQYRSSGRIPTRFIFAWTFDDTDYQQQLIDAGVDGMIVDNDGTAYGVPEQGMTNIYSVLGTRSLATCNDNPFLLRPWGAYQQSGKY